MKTISEKKGTELILVSGIKLVEIKTHKRRDDVVVTAEALRNIDPSSLTGMRIYQGKTKRIIGYVANAWKREGWWLADLRLYANVSLGVAVGEDGQTTPFEVNWDCKYLDPDPNLRKKKSP